MIQDISIPCIAIPDYQGHQINWMIVLVLLLKRSLSNFEALWCKVEVVNNCAQFLADDYSSHLSILADVD